MHNIEQDFPIRVAPELVYAAVSTPAQLDEWWTLRSTGAPVVGARYALDFGPEYRWVATVRAADPGRSFEVEIIEADVDWTGTVVGFRFLPSDDGTAVSFYHNGWRVPNAHFRTTTHCWALYLRILRRFLEHGERVPYAQRLDV